MAASISTVDVELVSVKGESSSNVSRNSWASKGVIGGKGDNGRAHRRTGSVGDQKKMFLGKEIFIDARTERRVKWAHRGIGAFSFFGVLCFIVGTSISNNVLRIIAIVCCFNNTDMFCCFILQERIVCDDETTVERTKRDHYYDVERMQLGYRDWSAFNLAFTSKWFYVYADCKLVCIDGHCDFEKPISDNWLWDSICCYKRLQPVYKNIWRR